MTDENTIIENEGGSQPLEGAATPDATASQVGGAEVEHSDEFNTAWDNAFGSGSTNTATAKADSGEALETGATTDEVKPEDEAGKLLDATKQTPSGAKPNAGAVKADQEALATLPRTLRSAAERAGFNEADLARDINTFGVERVSGMLEKLHGGFNDLSTRYAALGRAAQPQQGQPATPASSAAPATSTIDALFEPKALEEIKAEYGDKFVTQVLVPLRAELAGLRDVKTHFQQQQMTALQGEINGIFGGIGDEYVPLYGKGGMDQITPEAREHRLSVLREADIILGGAQRAGISMATREAVERAHNLYVAPRRAEFERKALAAKVKGRAGSITSRPTARRAPATSGEGVKKSDATAIEALRRREGELGVEFFED